MSMTEAARQIRKLIEITANNLTDEQAAKLPYCFPEWKEGIEAKTGERYTVRRPVAYAALPEDEDKQEDVMLFKCTKSHTTSVENMPEDPEYWKEI